MYIELTPEQRALQAELREYFSNLISPEEAKEMEADRHGKAYRAVIKRMGSDGKLGVGWPKEFGGLGYGPIEQSIFVNEAHRADVPLPAVTLQTVGPTLQVYGSDAQKKKFLPGILAGEVHFAIGYTEPEAGTDLASLRTSAVRHGDEYIVNGQKVFTTGGHDADYIWLACRTDPEAVKHKGISMLIVDTTDPGYSWTPMILSDGAHHTNATYYNDVRVPADMLVGEENGGWRLITTQLNNERVMLGPAGRFASLYDRIHSWASKPGSNGDVPLDHDDVKRSLGELKAMWRINELLNWQVAASGETIDVADAAATKVFGTERIQYAGRLAEEIVGAHGNPADADTAELLEWLDSQTKRNLVITFGGGVNEVMREMIAASGLKVPRVPTVTPEEIHRTVADIKAAGPSKPRAGRDPVNQPMIRHWVDAIGDDNPIYIDEAAAKTAGHPGIVAPPAMIQVWTMMGLGGDRPGDDPIGPIMELFDGAGYVGVVATNCDQTYHRYLRPGEDVSVVAELTDVVGPKQTALGEGYFISQRITWQVGDEDVAEMDWRILKFIPREQGGPAPSEVPDDLDADSMMRPASSRDTKFFWDGVSAHELRIQKRPDGSLQHPPVPALWQDKEAPTDYLVASGKGTVFSFVVHHAPKVPGRTLPFVIALVELEEGVRMLGELRNVDPATVEIGMPVRATYIDFPEGKSGPAWTLYAWEPDT